MNAKKFVFGGFALTLLAAVSASGPTVAAGNLVTGATAITTTITADFKLSGDKFDLETGKYYNWTIKCDARCDNLQFQALDLFRNSFINQISVGDMEIHTPGPGVYLEFDGGGQMNIYFVVMRAGAYTFTMPSKGLTGTITAK